MPATLRVTVHSPRPLAGEGLGVQDRLLKVGECFPQRLIDVVPYLFGTVL